MHRLAFWIVIRYLKRIRNGSLKLELPSGEILTLGKGDRPLFLLVRRERFFSRILAFGDTGFAEAYMDGDFETPDLSALLCLLASSAGDIGGRSGFTPGILGILHRYNTLRHRMAFNSRRQAKKNIAAHYDLSPNFFSRFLDPTMIYSAARFEQRENGMQDRSSLLQGAQYSKLDHLIDLLELDGKREVLEIGSGWGEMACRIAEKYPDIKVLSITLSGEQQEFARERVRERGLSDRVRIEFMDYREVMGMFDSIVSVEMIEAVGLEYLDTFFRTCRRLLAPGGKLVLQSITIPERFLSRYRRKADFIQKYIFPGGMLPSVPLLLQSATVKNDLELEHFEDRPMDYARTLDLWREAFHASLAEVRTMGFDNRFLRMWDYYLSYCEAGFLTGSIGLARLSFRNPGFQKRKITGITLLAREALKS